MFKKSRKSKKSDSSEEEHLLDVEEENEQAPRQKRKLRSDEAGLNETMQLTDPISKKKAKTVHEKPKRKHLQRKIETLEYDLLLLLFFLYLYLFNTYSP